MIVSGAMEKMIVNCRSHRSYWRHAQKFILAIDVDQMFRHFLGDLFGFMYKLNVMKENSLSIQPLFTEDSQFS